MMRARAPYFLAILCCFGLLSIDVPAHAEGTAEETKARPRQAQKPGEEKTPTKPTKAKTAPSYQELRQQYQSQLDKCDLINAQRVLSLNATPVANIIEETEKWRKILKKTKNKRLKCYKKARETLEQTIAAGMASLQSNEQNTALAARLEIDKQAADLLAIRTRLNGQLLERMRADLDNTLEAYNNTKEKEDKPSYVIESAKTTDLIRQDMGIVLELERRQLNLESRLVHNRKNNEKALTKLKLKTALHYLSRALMAYEDVNRIKPARLLATLRSEYLYAAGQMHEILALSPNLTHVPQHMRQNMLQLANRMQLMELDVEGALSDFRNGDLEEPLEDWLSEVYQDFSNLSVRINKILKRFDIPPPIMLDSNADMEIPDDIADFIEEGKQTSPDKRPTKKTNHQNTPPE